MTVNGSEKITEKKCGKCNEVKDVSLFCKSTNRPNGCGYINLCKQCRSIYNKQYYSSHMGEHAEYRRNYYIINRTLIKKNRREYYLKNKDMIFLYLEKYYRENPLVRKAHARVQKAIIRGTLVPQLCEFCKEEKIQAHHEDYTKPLDVWWLCSSCHQILHSVKRGELDAHESI